MEYPEERDIIYSYKVKKKPPIKLKKNLPPFQFIDELRRMVLHRDSRENHQKFWQIFSGRLTFAMS
jgi:hypothetical protein